MEKENTPEKLEKEIFFDTLVKKKNEIKTAPCAFKVKPATTLEKIKDNVNFVLYKIGLYG